MSLSLEAETISSNTGTEEFYWGENVPKDLQEPATLVSKLAIDLFKKLKVHPNVYIPSNKKFLNDFCIFLWYANPSDDNLSYGGSIQLGRSIEPQKGKKIETSEIYIRMLQKRNTSSPFNNNQISFLKPESGDDNYQVLPEEFHKEAKNLVNVAHHFFQRLIEHPDVIVLDGGKNVYDWEKFPCYDKNGDFYRSIGFSDRLIKGDRVRTLDILGRTGLFR